MMDGSHMRPPIKDDVARDDPSILKMFGISKMTLIRWRSKHRFPDPAFYVGPKGFTWQSDIQHWIDSRPRTSNLSGRVIPRGTKADNE
jgi:predicted DNA-binding transcriptional regulator AlpA